ncbi:MAG: hypothetical protein WA869_12225 [Alloacidobacterium sp.]|jgi:hypothetical protein
MSQEARDKAILSALHKAVRGTPLSLFPRLTSEGDTVSEVFNARLEDGTNVVFERRASAIQVSEAFRLDQDGNPEPLKDGDYLLKDGAPFRVSGGKIDFDAVLADPDGVEPFRQYGAWREVVAIDNPIFSLPDPLLITDIVRFVAPDANSYYAVQKGVDQPYKAYVVVNHALQPLADGEYSLPGEKTYKVANGEVHPDSLANFKAFAHQSTRLPR